MRLKSKVYRYNQKATLLNGIIRLVLTFVVLISFFTSQTSGIWSPMFIILPVCFVLLKVGDRFTDKMEQKALNKIIDKKETKEVHFVQEESFDGDELRLPARIVIIRKNAFQGSIAKVLYILNDQFECKLKNGESHIFETMSVNNEIRIPCVVGEEELYTTRFTVRDAETVELYYRHNKLIELVRK